MVRVLVVWTAAVLATLFVAATTQAGPNLYTIRQGNGIHLSDVLFAGLAGGIALVFTYRSRRQVDA